MTAPDLMTEHPSDETLAAFVDARLNASSRRAVIEHLAECGECRTLLNDLTDLRAMEDDAAENVVPFQKRGGWRLAAAAAAIAAGLLVVFIGPLSRKWSADPSMTEIVNATASLDRRPSEGRLSAAFPYRAAEMRYRSSPVETSTDRKLRQELETLENSGVRDPHKLGVLYLWLGDHAKAIALLEEAAAEDERAKIDLAAALLARGRRVDAERALKLSEGSDEPKALWNRAVALKELEQYDRAIEAWEAYLKVDDSSQWAGEARTRIEKSKQDAARQQPPRTTT